MIREAQRYVLMMMQRSNNVLRQYGRKLRVIGQPGKPELADAEFWASFIAEEAAEVCTAMTGRPWACLPNIGQAAPPASLPAAVREWADLIVTVLSAAVASGVDLEPGFYEVASAYLNRLGPNAVAPRTDGKILKPPGWKPPDLAKVLRRQGWKE